MKTLNFLFLFSLAIFFVSCDNDDDSMASTSLQGTWELSALDYSGTNTVNSGGATSSVDFTGEMIENNGTQVVFNADGTYTSSGNYTIAVTSDFQGQSSTSNAQISGYAGNGTYDANGSTLTVTNEQNETGDMVIVELTSDKLVLDWDRIETTNQQGATSTSDIEGRYTFNRQ